MLWRRSNAHIIKHTRSWTVGAHRCHTRNGFATSRGTVPPTSHARTANTQALQVRLSAHRSIPNYLTISEVLSGSSSDPINWSSQTDGWHDSDLQPI